jgi:hypothetical protein
MVFNPSLFPLENPSVANSHWSEQILRNPCMHEQVWVTKQYNIKLFMVDIACCPG